MEQISGDGEEECRERRKHANLAARAREVADRGGQVVAKAVERDGARSRSPRARSPTSSA